MRDLKIIDWIDPDEDERITLEDIQTASRDAADHIETLEAQLAEARELHTPMVKFIDDIIEAVFDGCEYDGGELQEMLRGYGLLEQVTMNEPCSPDCQCSTVTDFPTECNRIAPAFLAASNAIRKEVGDE